MAKYWINKIIDFIYRYKFWIILFWTCVFFFFLLSGLTKYGDQLSMTVLFKAMDHRKGFLFIPVALVLCFIFYLKKIKLSKYTLIVLTIFYYLDMLGAQYLSYDMSNYYLFNTVLFFLKGIVFLVAIFYCLDWYENLRDKGLRVFKKIQQIQFGKFETIFFISMIVIGIGIRFINIDGLFPATDEYTHLVKAQSLLVPNSLISDRSILEYGRASIVTEAVMLSFKLFGVGIVQGRLPGVLLSVVSIVLLYLMLRKENKSLAIIASLDFALSPWLIMQSRVVREYIYFLPIYILFAVYIYKRIDAILDKVYKWYYLIIDILIAAMLYYYGMIFDGRSTFKLILLFYGVAIVYWIVRSICKEKTFLNKLFLKIKHKWNWIVGILIFFSALLLVSRSNNIFLWYNQISILPVFHPEVFDFLIMNDSKGTFIFGSVMVCLGIVYLINRIIKQKARPLENFSLISFLFLFYIFSFHFNNYVSPRYLFVILPSLILVESYGLLCIITFIKNFFSGNRKIKWILYFLLFNWLFIGIATFVKGGGVFMSSGNYYNTMPEINEYLKDKVSNDEIISSMSLGNEWFFAKGQGVTKIYYYNYTHTNRLQEISTEMALNPRGYFIIDEYINNLTHGKFVLGEDIEVGEKTLHFIYTNGSNYVYEWGH